MINIIICGCGALGSYIAMNIANENTSLFLIDDDKVSKENVFNGTSAYTSDLIGKNKVDALSFLLYRKYQIKSTPRIKTIRKPGQILNSLIPIGLVVDTFDNVKARACTVKLGVPILHVSIGEHGLGSIEWNNVYQLPETKFERGENPICTNEIGRNLILFTSTIASVIINKYLSTGVMESAYVNVERMEVYK